MPQISDFENSHVIHVISDGTGETAMMVLKAALVHHEQKQVQIMRHKNIRSSERVEFILEDAEKNKSFVVYTIVNPQLRQFIFQKCNLKGIPSIDLLGPILDRLQQFFGLNEETHTLEAGKLRAVDEKYFRRIEAMEFTVKHDDGKSLEHLNIADIVLLGISRTSKTPLSVFLSHKGFKVANIPIVLNQPLPGEIFRIDQRKIVGLTIDVDSLKKIRQNRAQKLGLENEKDYASLEYIYNEIQYSEQLFKANRRWPIINVTDRALEEVAGEILRIVGTRMGWNLDGDI